MANDVTHVLEINGPDAARFLAECFIWTEVDRAKATTGETLPELAIDFNLIMPIPQILLQLPDDGDVYEAIAGKSRRVAAGRKVKYSKAEIATIEEIVKGQLNSGPSVSSIDDFIALTSSDPKWTDLAGKWELRKIAKKTSGHTDWESWCTANWGCIRNAYNASTSGSFSRFEMRFDTSWAVPEGIFKAIADHYANLELGGMAMEEFEGFCAYVEISAGELSIVYSDVTDEDYENFFGCRREEREP